MVQLITTPWTPEGRNIALQKAIREIYDDYFARGPRWVAKHLPQRKEMGDWAGKITERTKQMVLGFLGVESFIEDYAYWTILASGESLVHQAIYGRWVYDENRHPAALRYALIDSELCTQAEVDEYIHSCGEDVWTFERQTGYPPTTIRGPMYAHRQERETKGDYRRLAEIVWEEYGCPRDPSGRPIYPAVAGILRTVGGDEGWHEGVFKRVALVYLRYWPERALEAAWEMDKKYRMPIVCLPNAEVFVQAVLETGVDHPRDIVKNVLQPVYHSMGLENRTALRKAAKLSQELPEGAVIQIGDKPSEDWSEGAIPYLMNPDGSLVPVAQAA